MKKVLSFILVLSMVLGSFGMAFAAPVQTGNPAIDKMVELGFVQGDENGLRLEDTIKRSETAVIVARVLGLEDVAKASNFQGIFSDVTPGMWTNPVMNGSINVVAGRGLVNGYPNGTFAPEATISNAEAVTIMVRMVVDAKEREALDKGVWPGNYLAKAAELGLLEGVSMVEFAQAATRETVFTLAYNAYSQLVEEGLTGYKALVVENYRTESIDKDEIVIEIIKDVQDADFAEIGDEYVITVDEKAGDVENLLGKVLDVKFDQKGNVAGYTVDNTYKYVTGKVSQLRENDLTIGGTRYTVEKQERRVSNDERFFQAYLNNQALTYENLLKELGKENTLDYARVTIKNGKVVFIDGFNFADIAPVVNTTNRAVTVLDDEASASERELALNNIRYVINYENGEFTLGDKADIAKDDVVHYFGSGSRVTVLVRKDAKIEDVYTRVRLNRVDGKDVTVVYLEDQEEPFALNFNKSRQGIYTTDYKDYYVLDSNRTADNLIEFKDKDVVVLLDINDEIQFIGAEVEKLEFVAIISDVLSRDVRLAKQNGETEVYRVTFDSKLTADGSSKEQNLSKFEKSDLVEVEVNEDNEIVTMKKVILEKAGDVDKITKDYIKVDGVDYRVARDTILFVDNGTVRKAMSIEDLIADYKTVVSSTNSDAPVGIKVEFNTSNADKDLDVIVFTKIEAKAEYTTDYLKVDRIYRSGRNYSILAHDEAGKEFELPVKSNSEAYDDVNADEVKRGDIIKVSLTKADKPEIAKVEVLVNYGEKVYEISRVEESGNKLTFVDKNGDVVGTYYLSRTALTFDGPLSRGKKVEFAYEGQYITYISVTTADLTGEVKEDATGVVTYINATGTRFEVDGVVYAVNEDTVLKEDGKTIAIGIAAIKAELVEGDKVSVEKNVITRTFSKAAADIATAEAAVAEAKAAKAAADQAVVDAKAAQTAAVTAVTEAETAKAAADQDVIDAQAAAATAATELEDAAVAKAAADQALASDDELDADITAGLVAAAEAAATDFTDALAAKTAADQAVVDAQAAALLAATAVTEAEAAKTVADQVVTDAEAAALLAATEVTKAEEALEALKA